jgi:hypothetical protein
VRNSPEERRIFAEIVKRFVPHSNSVGLILDVKTRWNSTYAMLERAENLRQAIERYLLNNDTLKLVCSLSAGEWLALSEIIKVLKPMATATEFVSKSKYPSLGSTLPIYVGLIEVHYFVIRKVKDSSLVFHSCLFCSKLVRPQQM